MSRRWLVDGAVAIAVAVVGAASVWQAGAGWAGAVVAAASGTALLARRGWPVVTLILTALAVVVPVTLGFPGSSLAFLVAVFTAMSVGRRWATGICAVAVLAALPVVFWLRGGSFGAAIGASRGALELAWLVAAAAAGEAVRQAEQRADQAERTREETARRRADDERLRIARELHDSLTHQISVIKLHSEVAVHQAGGDASERIVAIRDAARLASAELGSTLGALRSDTTTPGPTVDQLPELVDRARAAGLEATLRIDGDATTIPATVGSTAYRIVQEALTNVVRHAGSAPTSVVVARRPGGVMVEVVDAGSCVRTSESPGLGLLGMRERVAALGGQLSAAPGEGGGFVVRADLPVET